MPEYLAPGVYVEEVSFGAPPISGVSTSVAAFLGHAPDPQSGADGPVRVTSYAGFLQHFAANPGQSTHLQHAVRGYFQNGGAVAYIVPLPSTETSVTDTRLARLDPNADVSTVAAPGFFDAQSHDAMVTHAERSGTRMAVLDGPSTVPNAQSYQRAPSDGGASPPQAATGQAAFYAPWLEISDAVTGAPTQCPPSGHVCGLYARSDARRGVWKAPAGLNLQGVTGVHQSFGRADQAALNMAGINLIRNMPRGTVVWGARTLAGRSSDYKYVSVRRFATFVVQSLSRGLQWAVFEPNDARLWASVRRDISDFLHILWRDGALAGSKPDEAFFVRCDRSIMTQADIDAGRLIAQIGIAPLRPAEFVLLRLTQKKPED